MLPLWIRHFKILQSIYFAYEVGIISSYSKRLVYKHLCVFRNIFILKRFNKQPDAAMMDNFNAFRWCLHGLQWFLKYSCKSLIFRSTFLGFRSWHQIILFMQQNESLGYVGQGNVFTYNGSHMIHSYISILALTTLLHALSLQLWTLSQQSATIHALEQWFSTRVATRKGVVNHFVGLRVDILCTQLYYICFIRGFRCGSLVALCCGTRKVENHCVRYSRTARMKNRILLITENFCAKIWSKPVHCR